MKVSKHPFNHFLRGLLLLGIASTNSVMAAETDVNFSGFASLVYGKTLGNSKEGPLNEMTDEGEYRDFNKLGLRMDADLRDRVSFAAQLVAYGNRDYDPEFDWIYASIELDPKLRLDVGKTRFPLYMYSDFIDVGYAYQWIEPPYGTYGRSFFQALDGLKLNYVTNIGEWESELLVFGGRTEEHFKSLETPDNIDLLIDDVAGAAWTVEYEWLTLRGVYARGDISLGGFSGLEALITGVEGLAGGINGAIPGFVDVSGLVDTIAMQKDELQYAGFGLGMDFGQVFSVFEITQSRFDPTLITNHYNGGYLMLGTRLPHNLTLSTTYSEKRQKPNEKIAAEYWALMAPSKLAFAGTALETRIDALGAGIENAVNAAQDRKSIEYSLQLRWDFHRSAAFKFEYLLQDTNQVSPTTFFPEHVKPQAYRLGLDLVF